MADISNMAELWRRKHTVQTVSYGIMVNDNKTAWSSTTDVLNNPITAHLTKDLTVSEHIRFLN